MSVETFNPVLPGIAIFGTGIVVRVLTPILKRSGFRVVALWGRTPEDAKEIAADLVIPFYTSRFEGWCRDVAGALNTSHAFWFVRLSVF